MRCYGLTAPTSSRSSAARSNACGGPLGRLAEVRVGGIAGVLRTCSNCGGRQARLFTDGHDLAAELAPGAAPVEVAARDEPDQQPAHVEAAAGDRTASPPTPFGDLDLPDGELDLEALAGEFEPTPTTGLCPASRTRQRDELELESARELRSEDVGRRGCRAAPRGLAAAARHDASCG